MHFGAGKERERCQPKPNLDRRINAIQETARILGRNPSSNVVWEESWLPSGKTNRRMRKAFGIPCRSLESIRRVQHGRGRRRLEEMICHSWRKSLPMRMTGFINTCKLPDLFQLASVCKKVFRSPPSVAMKPFFYLCVCGRDFGRRASGWRA